MVIGPYDAEETLRFQISLVRLAGGTVVPDDGDHDTTELEWLVEQVPVRRSEPQHGYS